MTSYEQRLTEIATEMFSAEQLGRLDLISASTPFNLQAMSDFDDTIPGPSMRRLSEAVRQRLMFWSPGHDRLSISDRDVFRPLQYCATAFEADELDWRTREIVEKSGVHLEALVKRIGGAT